MTVPPGFSEGMTFDDKFSSAASPEGVTHAEEAQTLTISQLLFKDGVFLEDSDVPVEQTERVTLIMYC